MSDDKIEIVLTIGGELYHIECQFDVYALRWCLLNLA